VAVDASPAARPIVSGTEIYTRELCRRLPGAAPDLEWIFYSARPRPAVGIDLTVLPFPRLWSQLRLPTALAVSRPDLLFAPAHGIPLAWRGPAVMVVHDLAFERYPNAYPAAQRAYLSWNHRWAERRCSKLIAVSESTRRDLVELHGVEPGKVVVAHPGAGETSTSADARADRSRLQAAGVQEPFVLQLGRIEPRKNQSTSLAAVERVRRAQLVCAGPIADEALAARLRASERCRVLGWTGPALRDALLRRASALLMPSLYEGFGFPVLEAMAAGLPVITARNSSLPEIAGDAALYVDDALDAAALATQLESVLDDAVLRRRLGAAGRRRAKTFSWDACAATVAATLRSLL
jgi:glycosyltransferase involved in cell wall biosynthesis